MSTKKTIVIVVITIVISMTVGLTGAIILFNHMNNQEAITIIATDGDNSTTAETTTIMASDADNSTIAETTTGSTGIFTDAGDGISFELLDFYNDDRNNRCIVDINITNNNHYPINNILLNVNYTDNLGPSGAYAAPGYITIPSHYTWEGAQLFIDSDMIQSIDGISVKTFTNALEVSEMPKIKH